MTSPSRFIYFALLLSLGACGLDEFSEPPAVVFGEPQPAEVENLPEFPARLQGNYRGLAEGNLLEIRNKCIISTSSFEEKILLSELDSNLRLQADSLYDLRSGEKYQVRMKGDTIIRNFSFPDTVFKLNYDNVLRKFKGHYFLNTRLEGENWDVKKLSPEKGRLLIGTIRSGEDIDALQSITETAADTAFPRKFNLSRKQFREFLGKDGFRQQSIYIREKGLR